MHTIKAADMTTAVDGINLDKSDDGAYVLYVKIRTHALGPKTNKLGLRGCPGRWKHSVERACEALKDAETADACSHGAECDGGESGRRNVAYRYDGNNNKGIFE